VPSITIPAGGLTGTFDVDTARVTTPTSVTIYGGVYATRIGAVLKITHRQGANPSTASSWVTLGFTTNQLGTNEAAEIFRDRCDILPIPPTCASKQRPFRDSLEAREMLVPELRAAALINALVEGPSHSVATLTCR
jgi:hypothetical protein